MELLLVLVKPFLVFALLLLLPPAGEVLHLLAAAGLHLDRVHLDPSLREGVLTGLVLRTLRTLKRKHFEGPKILCEGPGKLGPLLLRLLRVPAVRQKILQSTAGDGCAAG